MCELFIPPGKKIKKKWTKRANITAIKTNTGNISIPLAAVNLVHIFFILPIYHLAGATYVRINQLRVNLTRVFTICYALQHKLIFNPLLRFKFPDLCFSFILWAFWCKQIIKFWYNAIS